MEQAARLSPSKLVLTSVLEPKDELNEVCSEGNLINSNSKKSIFCLKYYI